MGFRKRSLNLKLKKVTFDDRYDDRYWKQICAIAHRSTKGTCCYCLCRPSVEVHHIRYQDSYGAIAGRELPGLDVFPVCQDCHGDLHSSQHWVKDLDSPVLGNHQKVETVEILAMGYRLLSL